MKFHLKFDLKIGIYLPRGAERRVCHILMINDAHHAPKRNKQLEDGRFTGLAVGVPKKYTISTRGCIASQLHEVRSAEESEIRKKQQEEQEEQEEKGGHGFLRAIPYILFKI